MKRLLSLAMAFVMVYTLGLCVFASASDIGATAVSAGASGLTASYNGVTQMPDLANVDVRSAYDGGIILNPYQTDVSSASSSVNSTLSSWGDGISGQKTKPVISVPIWIRNGAECAIAVGIKDAQVIPAANRSITVATSPITKATTGKQVFLYMDAQPGGSTNGSSPPATLPTFEEYQKSNKNQFAFPATKSPKAPQLLRIAPPTAGQSNWGALKICGGVNSEFKDLSLKWETEDTISVSYVLKIVPSL